MGKKDHEGSMTSAVRNETKVIVRGGGMTRIKGLDSGRRRELNDTTNIVERKSEDKDNE